MYINCLDNLRTLLTGILIAKIEVSLLSLLGALPNPPEAEICETLL